MKISDLKRAIKECIVDMVNEIAEDDLNAKLDRLMAVSPNLKHNLKKLRAEPVGSGSTWAVVLYDKRDNKIILVGGLDQNAAKGMLPQIKDIVLAKFGVKKDDSSSTDTSFFVKE